ncbi:MAG: hypothetical protein WBW32_12175 [Luteibacter sp.]
MQRKGWVFEYGDGSFTFREKKLVTIRKGSSGLNMTAQFAHEIGHADYSYKPDFSSRDAYVRKACTDEGFGLIENIVAHNAMNICAAIHLGLTTAEPDLFLAKYAELAQKPPILANGIGYMFCERNSVRQGLTYLDYYGDWYDANYGKAIEPASIEVEPTLWRELAEAADAGVRGGSALRTVWPATVRTVRDIAPNSGVNRWEGGARKLSSTVTMSGTEVRTDMDDNVIVASGRIEGRCIVRAEVMKYYPALEITQPPSPHGPQRTVWSAYGEWGQISFGFSEEAPRCLESIAMIPHPEADEE